MIVTAIYSWIFTTAEVPFFTVYNTPTPVCHLPPKTTAFVTRNVFILVVNTGDTALLPPVMTLNITQEKLYLQDA